MVVDKYTVVGEQMFKDNVTAGMIAILIMVITNVSSAAEPAPVSRRFVELAKKAMSDPYYGTETQRIARAFEYYNTHFDRGKVPPLYIWRLRGALLLLQINGQIRQHYISQLPQGSPGREFLYTLDRRYMSVADTVVKSLSEMGDRIDEKELYRSYVVTSGSPVPR